MSKEYDPFMHTAEHVLNQTMVRMFGWAFVQFAFECGQVQM